MTIFSTAAFLVGKSGLMLLEQMYTCFLPKYAYRTKNDAVLKTNKIEFKYFGDKVKIYQLPGEREGLYAECCGNNIALVKSERIPVGFINLEDE